MYWEEVIELIKTHTDDVVSEYPNPLNDGDYITYEYERGTVKSSYIHIDEFPEKIKDVLKPYLKYGITDLQIFSSLGPSEGIGIHNDPTNVLILCLESLLREFFSLFPAFGLATPFYTVAWPSCDDARLTKRLRTQSHQCILAGCF